MKSSLADRDIDLCSDYVLPVLILGINLLDESSSDLKEDYPGELYTSESSYSYGYFYSSSSTYCYCANS